MEQDKNMISGWLEQNPNLEIEKFISRNLAITEKVRKALEEKGWSKAKLAEEMGKRPSEVSKWLSGMHNITLKSIVKMEIALDIDLIQLEPKKEVEYVVFEVLKGFKYSENKDSDYKEYQEGFISMAI